MREAMDSPNESDSSGGQGDATECSPEQVLLCATRQADVNQAINYIAEGLYLDARFDHPQVLRALCALAPVSGSTGLAAVRRLAREVAHSKLNTAAVLLKPGLITPPSEYRGALDVLAAKSASRSLGDGITYRTVLAAQRVNSHVIPTLAAIAGLSWSDLVQRAGLTHPRSADGPWTPEAARLAFDVIEDIVLDRVRADISDGFPSRPIELLGDPDIGVSGRCGWAVVEEFRTRGVPYEVLLAQRIEGGAWRTHRDRTGGKYSHVLADELCVLLDRAGVKYLRAKNCGGALSAAQIEENVGGGGDQVALIVLNEREQPTDVLAISVANDGGSAAKSGARLAKLPDRVNVPVSALVAGLGWAARNETADLALALSGRLFSDANMPSLVHTFMRSPGPKGS